MKKRMTFVFPAVIAWCLGGCGSKSASIGIIGGADGPTAIFVTSGLNRQSICGWIGAIAVAALVAVIIWRRKKK